MNSLNNEIFLYEQNLDSLIQVLMLDQDSPFDSISLNDEGVEEKLAEILK